MLGAHSASHRLQIAEVRLNVIGKIELVQAVIGSDEVASKLIPEIVSLSEDEQVASHLTALLSLAAVPVAVVDGVISFLMILLLLFWQLLHVFRASTTAHPFLAVACAHCGHRDCAAARQVHRCRPVRCPAQ